jgi:uncharacterized glyoxalase superfamily protein PhnB
MKMLSLTPVLIVEEIESCLDFWYGLGFEKTMEVPTGDTLGFVILKKDNVEVMYQTIASVKEDVASLADAPLAGAHLFLTVDDVDAIDKAVGSAERVIPRRKTFYGSEEVIVREPAGNVVTFAQFGE